MNNLVPYFRSWDVMPYLLQFMKCLDYVSLRAMPEKFQHYLSDYYQDILVTAESCQKEVLRLDFIETKILNDLGRPALINKAP